MGAWDVCAGHKCERANRESVQSGSVSTSGVCKQGTMVSVQTGKAPLWTAEAALHRGSVQGTAVSFGRTGGAGMSRAAVGEAT